MAKYYVEAYYADYTQKLGTLDGQAVIRASNLRRTNHYKALKEGCYFDGRKISTVVKYWKIVTEAGDLVERIDNPFWQKEPDEVPH